MSYLYWNSVDTITGKASDIDKALGPVIQRLKKYDDSRVRLEQQGGRVADLKQITGLFNTSFPVKNRYRTDRIKLCDQEDLKNVIRSIGEDLHLTIRRLHTGMPAYYISRIKSDFWSEYGLLVEDLYMSPGYPLNDERFVKLMDRGNEVYFLRLSQFRKRLAKIAGKNNRDDRSKVDQLLYGLGRHVFQAAWHEDQQLAISVANLLGLFQFHDAIELLYLCLSGELCELRSAVDETMLRFFETIYPQPAIHSFLEMLGQPEGAVLMELPKKAVHLYKRLSRAFSNFLVMEVNWGPRGIRMPVWKILYANFSRLDCVCRTLKKESALMKVAGQLEREARDIISEVLDTASSSRGKGGDSRKGIVLPLIRRLTRR